MYKSQAAKDAQATGFGNQKYWDYLDKMAQEHYKYFITHGDQPTAELMLTRSLSEVLDGNNGD